MVVDKILACGSHACGCRAETLGGLRSTARHLTYRAPPMASPKRLVPPAFLFLRTRAVLFSLARQRASVREARRPNSSSLERIETDVIGGQPERTSEARNGWKKMIRPIKPFLGRQMAARSTLVFPIVQRAPRKRRTTSAAPILICILLASDKAYELIPNLPTPPVFDRFSGFGSEAAVTSRRVSRTDGAYSSHWTDLLCESQVTAMRVTRAEKTEAVGLGSGTVGVKVA